jgi:hypothetical protein
MAVVTAPNYILTIEDQTGTPYVTSGPLTVSVDYQVDINITQLIANASGLTSGVTSSFKGPPTRVKLEIQNGSSPTTFYIFWGFLTG